METESGAYPFVIIEIPYLGKIKAIPFCGNR